MTTDGPIVTVSNVRHRYRGADRDALAGVSLSIEAGSCFGLLGPNGAGKSTLLGLLTGAIKLQDGEIEIMGASVRTDLPAVRAASAIAPQELAFYPALTGRENLEFFAGVQNVEGALRKTRIAEASAACQLDDVLDRRAETYSGGLKRRLNLAIALVGAPRILYLDEPTVGIDARSRALIVDAIAALKRSGFTIIYISHYMEEVEALCDSVAVIDKGSLIALERTEALVRRGAERRLRVTLAAPLDEAARQSLVPAQWIDAARFDVTLDGEAALEGWLARIRAAGGHVARLDYGASKLETIYLGLLEQDGGP
ncbi:MAG: ABC transporter ATP-binding protein [Alphaproteobacteria bacterium]|nr:ABC transporter ATP-binding protein [Alphaproteobacteria bacterium]